VTLSTGFKIVTHAAFFIIGAGGGIFDSRFFHKGMVGRKAAHNVRYQTL